LPDAPPRILERLVDIGDELSLDCRQASMIFSPNSESVTRMSARQPLINQPSIEQLKRQT